MAITAGLPGHFVCQPAKAKVRGFTGTQLNCFVNTGVGQHANPFDFDGAGITLLKITRRIHRSTHARWCTGENQVTRLQRDDFRKMGDECGYVKDQLSGRAILNGTTVEVHPDSKI